eukprot:XP_016656647.1 PREDICTED: mitochondrial coenzyme A transporter SLC25A42-like [Acyrthosiphon pisum]
MWNNFAAGAMTGAVAKTTIALIDKIKIHAYIYIYAINQYQEGGLKSFWKGNTAAMARILPYAGIQFTTFDINNGRIFVAGSLAGLTSQTVTYPLDLVGARMIVDKQNYYTSIGDLRI